MEIVGISEVELVCTYGPGDNYNPCNRGKRQHILHPQEQELRERYSKPQYGLVSWECPGCGNHAIRVDIKNQQKWISHKWEPAPEYWQWI